MRTLRNTTNAFTLLEIMLVVMIIGILAGSAIYLMKDNVGEAQRIKAEGDIKLISTQLMIYESRNGFLPTTSQGLNALVEKPSGEPVPRKWSRLLPGVPTDPWGSEYVLEVPAKRSKSDRYDLYSKGPDRQAGTEDDIGNWE